jgi:hypothetical protein
MHCRYCGKDPELIVLVPQKGGQSEPFACLECSIAHGIYCRRHDKPHTGFVDGDTTACLDCVVEEVTRRREFAEEYYSRLKGGLSEEAWEELSEAAEDASEIMNELTAVSVLRFLVTASHRLALPVEDLLVQILDRRSASILLPHPPL